MSNEFYCYACKAITPELDMMPYSEFNPDAGYSSNYLACPCGEREEITEDVYTCDKCAERFPREEIVSGTDTCTGCAS